MSNATLSLLGLYYADDELFENFEYPEEIDGEVLIDNLLMETAELEVVYSDPRFMKLAIGAWSKKELPIWEKLYNTTILEYNPIWNKDGKVTEIETNKREHTGTNIDTGSSSGSEKNSSLVHNGSESSSRGHTGKSTEAEAETINSVAAFNATTFQNRDKSDTDSMSYESSIDAVDTKDTQHSVKTDELSTAMNDQRLGKQSSSDDDKRVYERIEQGNIGVTTTQSMIQEEREVVQFNVINYIIDSFKQRFCLLVY